MWLYSKPRYKMEEAYVGKITERLARLSFSVSCSTRHLWLVFGKHFSECQYSYARWARLPRLWARSVCRTFSRSPMVLSQSWRRYLHPLQSSWQCRPTCVPFQDSCYSSASYPTMYDISSHRNTTRGEKTLTSCRAWWSLGPWSLCRTSQHRLGFPLARYPLWCHIQE